MGLTNRVLRQCNVARATEKEAEPNGSIEGLGRHASSALQRVGPSLKAVFNAFTELLVPLDLAAEIGGRPYWMPRERMAKLAGRLGWVAESTYGGKTAHGRLLVGGGRGRTPRSRPRQHPVTGLVASSILVDRRRFRRPAARGRVRPTERPPRVSRRGVARRQVRGRDARGLAPSRRHGALGRNDMLERRRLGQKQRVGGDPGQLRTPRGILGGPAVLGNRRQGDVGHQVPDEGVPRVAGRVVALGMDNAGNQFAINSGKASSPECKRILAEIYDAADELRCRFYAVWIPRAFNRPSDLLCKTSSFLIACRDAEAAGLALHFRQWTQGRPPA